MNKVLRASSVVVAAALAVPLWAVPNAFAASVEEAATNGAYYYSAGIDKPEAAPAAPPNVTGTATDGVAPEHLAVAVRAPGQIDKLSFLSFDLATVPFDATVDRALLTVPLAENSPAATDPRQANMLRNAAPSKVRVCAAGDEGFSGEDGASTQSAPSFDCEAFAAPAKETADKKAYTFEITGLAAMWLAEANNGLALVPAEGADSTEFQVVFLPAAEATIAVEFTEIALDDVTDVATPDVPLTPGVDSGFSGGIGTVDSGGFGSVEAPVVDTVLPEPQTMGAPAPAPAVATPVRNVAAVSAAPLTPTLGFWLGLLAIAGVLLVLSLIMGDTRIASPAAARTSRLSRALQQRERGHAAGRGPRLATI